MSEQSNFNRTRNSTRRPSTGNRSNTSDFGGNQGNGGGGDWSENEPEVLFYLLSMLSIPAMVCFIFLFGNFIRLPQLRARAANLLIIGLLIVNFAHILSDLPFRLFFLFKGDVPFTNPIFCLLWTWSDGILTTIDLYIMAMASIERYFSVFHHVFLRYHPYLLCHVPLLLCLAVPTIWYSVLIFAYPCQQSFSRSTLQCGAGCYLTSSPIFGHVENFLFFVFPLLIIVLGNGTLVGRVLAQKRSMKRRRRLRLWRNNLRMITQLMFIAVLYMSIYVPSCILLIFGNYVRRTRFQPWAVSIRTRYFIHLKYLVIFGSPFVILAGQKEMHPPIKKLLTCNKFRRVQQWKTRIHALTIIHTQNRKDNE